MQKFLNGLFNIFWFIFIGLECVIVNALVGAGCCITLIGIPFGLQYFKFIKLIAVPAGRKVITRFGQHPVMNSLWLIFGGLEVLVLYGLLGCICCITIIGIPLGKQLFKIAGFNFAPFGCIIVKDGYYSADKNTIYDYELLFARVNADGTKTLPDAEKPCSVREYVAKNSARACAVETELYNFQRQPYNRTIDKISFACLVGVVLIGVFLGIEGILSTDLLIVLGIIVGVIYILAFYISYSVRLDKKREALLLEYKIAYERLFLLYPDGSPTQKYTAEPKGFGVKRLLAEMKVKKISSGSGDAQ